MHGSIKWFVVERPPLVIFTVCLAAFAVGALSLAYRMRQGQGVKDPDVVDWNDIMDKFSELVLCVKRNDIVHGREGDHGWEPEYGARRHDDDVSVAVQMTMAAGVALSSDIFRGSVALDDLGVHGHGNVRLRVSVDLGPRHQLVNCTADGLCTVVPGACVTFSGAVQPLPLIPESRKCGQRETEDGLWWSYVHGDSDKICPSGGVALQHRYVHAAALTTTIDRKEQQLIEMHLTYTGCFLFLVVVAIVCVATVRGVL